eukprot:13962500-Alexandrium_andersonii.AAC.1
MALQGGRVAGGAYDNNSDLAMKIAIQFAWAGRHCAMDVAIVQRITNVLAKVMQAVAMAMGMWRRWKREGGVGCCGG